MPKRSDPNCKIVNGAFVFDGDDPARYECVVVCGRMTVIDIVEGRAHGLEDLVKSRLVATRGK